MDDIRFGQSVSQRGWQHLPRGRCIHTEQREHRQNDDSPRDSDLVHRILPPMEETQVQPKAKLGSKRGIETMLRTTYRVHMDLTSLADAKANIMISINGIIISIIIASISPKIDTNPWLLIPTSLMLVGCLVSIVYAVISARPRVSRDAIRLEDIRTRKANILFFGHYSHLSADEFESGMTELMTDNDLMYRNMIRDIYGLGSVLSRKFELLRIAYNMFMVGLVTGILSFIGVYIWIVLTLES